jgi:16S rRNA (uracil1498-N3)-methyltransferase
VGDTVRLSGDEAHHAATVARLATGENTLVGDGHGTIAQAEVSELQKTQVVLRVLSVDYRTPPQPEVWLAQALAKGDRDERAIQVATELGVSGVIPFTAKRSVSQWRGEKVDKGVARWKKIVTEATKQALLPHIPVVSEPKDSSELLALVHQYEIVVLDPQGHVALSSFRPHGTTPLLLVVGPEGGLAPEEREAFAAGGATIARLGESVLRTSSAGPAALAVLNVTLGRW